MFPFAFYRDIRYFLTYESLVQWQGHPSLNQICEFALRGTLAFSPQ